MRIRFCRFVMSSVSAAICVLAVAACTPGVAPGPSGQGGAVTARSVSISVSGAAAAYDVVAAPAVAAPGGGLVTAYSGSSTVVSVHGTLGYDHGSGAGPALSVSLDAGLGGMFGSVSVLDPSAAVSVVVTGLVSSFAVDDHGDVSGTLTDGAVSVAFSTSSSPLAPGVGTALASLVGDEATYCADAQQRLAGLDPSEVPLASIVNTRETPRSAFAASKSVLTPLTTRTWSDTFDVVVDGQVLTVSHHISCKTRSADHVATTGVATGPDLACSALNQRSIDLALARMTPAQRDAVAVPALGADVVRQTGVEWTTPLPDASEFDGTTLRAHALRVDWTDPAFALFPDTIRGVHYCTVWSPAYAYVHLLETLP